MQTAVLGFDSLGICSLIGQANAAFDTERGQDKAGTRIGGVRGVEGVKQAYEFALRFDVAGPFARRFSGVL